MGVWAKPPLQQVVFRIGFPVDLGIANRVAAFQKSRGYLAEVVLGGDEKRPLRGIVSHYRLTSPNDPNFVISVTHTDAHFIEMAYTDWGVFRQKILDHLALTPFPDEMNEHDFIGLAYLDRLNIFPTQDGSIPIEKYLRISMDGPKEFFGRKFQRAAWETDYQMGGPADLMRFNVRSEEPDEDGIEHLIVSVDRRIVGPDRTPVDTFLAMAHQDTKRAFEALLQPDYLCYLKEGNGPHGSAFNLHPSA